MRRDFRAPTKRDQFLIANLKTTKTTKTAATSAKAMLMASIIILVIIKL